MSSTIYKLFAGLLAKRLSVWAESNNVLSSFQKGFRPFDSTIENIFLLQKCIAKARRLQQELFILLIDFKNAFGSVPHAALIRALEAAGAGQIFTTLTEDIYSENFTHLLTGEGVSEEIPVHIGVNQGCPLSGSLFNLFINPIFALIQNSRLALHILGYADDIAVLENTEAELQQAIDLLEHFAKCLGL